MASKFEGGLEMKIVLTPDQAKEVALDWIREQNQTEEGCKEVLATLFSGMHFSNARWDQMLWYAIKLCSSLYHVPVKEIVKEAV